MTTNRISHHLEDDLIWDAINGKLTHGESLIVHTHVEMCHDCAINYEKFLAAAGELFEMGEDAPLGEDALEIALARIELSENQKPELSVSKSRSIYGFKLPKSLAKAKIKKRHFLGPNVWIAPIETVSNRGKSQSYLLWVKSGMSMLNHTHSNREFTQILDGGFIDGSKAYAKGDLAICDDNLVHAPSMFADEDCLCLVYQDGPIRPTSLLGHLIKPFARI